MDFQNYTKAILIGEPTSGKPNHFGEVKTMTLPESKFALKYSTKYFTHSKKDTDSIIPDLLVETSIDDFVNGIDPVYEAIVKYNYQFN